MPELLVRDLGFMDYAEALAEQEKLVALRKQNLVPDTLLLVEHPHVFTLGRNARAENVLRVPAGTAVQETNRGGDVTYHGPGQLVGYPIVDLAARNRRDVAWYMRTIEAALIAVIAEFRIAGYSVPGLAGVWVGDNKIAPNKIAASKIAASKIAAMGVHLSRWVTSHGFALNVSPDLGFFDCIVPCGLRDYAVTSMERELGRTISIEEVKRVAGKMFAGQYSMSKDLNPT